MPATRALGGVMGSSPVSSPIQTTYGTPSTVPTLVSPANSGETKLGGHDRHQGGRVRPRPAPIAIPPRASSSSFSAAAQEFTPGPLTGVNPSALLSSAVNSIGAFFSRPEAPASGFGSGNGGASVSSTSPVSSLVAESTPDYTDVPGKVLTGRAQDVVPGVIGRPDQIQFVVVTAEQNTNVSLSKTVRVQVGVFTIEDDVQRILQITHPTPLDDGYIRLCFTDHMFRSLSMVDTKELHAGVFYLGFADPRDAKQAGNLAVSMTHPGCDVLGLGPKRFARVKRLDDRAVSDHWGQYILTLVPAGNQTFPICYEDLKSFLEQHGDIKAMWTHYVDQAPENVLIFQIEWYDLNQGLHSATTLNGMCIRGYIARIQPFNVDVTALEPSSAHLSATFEDDRRPDSSLMTPSLQNPLRASVTGRSLLDPVETQQIDRQYGSYIRQAVARAPNRNNNRVILEHINLGLDVRTTIMLRNIPNRVNHDQLKDMLDITSFGEYDFMYLRIDFANNCNVGYAFINFVDSNAIAPFARARAGKRWNVFNSDKVAEISYATIQGRDCLIQKFRNSSVMLERSAFRPKLYTTGRGPEAGKEEPFPGPNNESKLHRSVANAAQIGLFQPCSMHPGTYRDDDFSPRDESHLAQETPRVGHSIRGLLGPATPAETNSPSTPGSPLRAITYPTSLYAPNESQSQRDRLRRFPSQFDRGTPGAEQEARMNELAESFQTLSASERRTQSSFSPAVGSSPMGPSFADGTLGRTEHQHNFGGSMQMTPHRGFNNGADQSDFRSFSSPINLGSAFRRTPRRY